MSIWDGFLLIDKHAISWNYWDIYSAYVPGVIPFVNNNHGGFTSFILQEDTCGPQRAKYIATYLDNKDVVGVNWPAQSPDLLERYGA